MGGGYTFYKRYRKLGLRHKLIYVIRTKILVPRRVILRLLQQNAIAKSLSHVLLIHLHEDRRSMTLPNCLIKRPSYKQNRFVLSCRRTGLAGVRRKRFSDQNVYQTHIRTKNRFSEYEDLIFRNILCNFLRF